MYWLGPGLEAPASGGSCLLRRRYPLSSNPSYHFPLVSTDAPGLENRYVIYLSGMLRARSRVLTPCTCVLPSDHLAPRFAPPTGYVGQTSNHFGRACLKLDFGGSGPLYHVAFGLEHQNGYWGEGDGLESNIESQRKLQKWMQLQ